jgi:hypothetical protein
MTRVLKLLVKYAAPLAIAGALLGFTLRVESRISRLEGSYDLILQRLTRIEDKLDAVVYNRAHKD